MVRKLAVTQRSDPLGNGVGVNATPVGWQAGLLVGCLLLLVALLGFGPGAQADPSPSTPATPGAMAVSTASVQGRAAPSLGGAAESAMPPDMQRILARGKLTVAVLGQDNAPFFVEQEGQLTGLDIQLARSLAEQLGVTLEITRLATTFDQVVDMVYGQRADLAISKISRTLKRAQRVRFSRPYLRMRQGLLVNRLQLAEQVQGRSMVETIRDLRGKVGVIKGSSYVGFLKQKFPQATIVEYPAWEAIVDAVVQGDILAAYRDELEIKKVVRTQPDAALQLQTIALTDTQDSLAVVLPWSSTHLLAVVDQALETLTTPYTVDTVLDEYAHYWDLHSPQQP